MRQGIGYQEKTGMQRMIDRMAGLWGAESYCGVIVTR